MCKDLDKALDKQRTTRNTAMLITMLRVKLDPANADTFPRLDVEEEIARPANLQSTMQEWPEQPI